MSAVEDGYDPRLLDSLDRRGGRGGVAQRDVNKNDNPFRCTIIFSSENDV